MEEWYRNIPLHLRMQHEVSTQYVLHVQILIIFQNILFYGDLLDGEDEVKV